MRNIRFGLPLLILCAALFLSGTAMAAEYSGTWPDYELKPGYGGTWTLDSEGTLTFEGKGVIPPEEANGWAEWLPYRDSVKKIVIGSGVTKLTYHVFAEYENLQAVEIPNTVTAILDSAFRDCTSLTSVTIPSSVVSLSADEDGAHIGSFKGCTSLREADIAAKEIGPKAFIGCTALSKVTLREGVASLGKEAFYDCALTDLTIPASLTDIEPGAVGRAPDLQRFETAAGNPAYQSVDGVLFSKDGATLVMYPFGRNGAYSIPAGTEAIEGYAFWECRGLTGVDIPEGVSSIGDYAFDYCTALTEAVLPASVRTVGEYAFGHCSKLSRLELGGVESMGKRAFGDCEALTAVVLPESLGSVGPETFFSCVKLTSVTVPGSLKEVSDNMFASCLRISSVTLEEGVERIGASAFSSNHLRVVTIPRSVKQIGNDAFRKSTVYTDTPTVYYAGTEAEWDQIAMAAASFDDPVRFVYESEGPDRPVLLSSRVEVKNYPSNDGVRLVLIPTLNNIGPAGSVIVCAAYYGEGGRMAGFREARLQVEPGERTYDMDPLVFEGLSPGSVESVKVFILDGQRSPLAKIV